MINKQPALHRKFIREGLMTEEESNRIVSDWEDHYPRDIGEEEAPEEDHYPHDG